MGNCKNFIDAFFVDLIGLYKKGLFINRAISLGFEDIRENGGNR